MVRALTTLLGLAAAAAILYFVSDVGDSGGRIWLVALVWAAAGLAFGVLYQAGGRRSPGIRANVPLLVLGFLPWTVLTAALVAVAADNPRWLADRARDFLPDSWIDRWEVSLPVFAFGSGLLLAFATIEPRVGRREPAPPDSAHAEITPWEPTPAAEPVVEQPAIDHPVQAEEPTTAVEERPTPVVEEAPTPLRLTERTTDEPAPAVEPQREGRPDA